MTKPIEEFEISALIDGELEPVRASELRAAIEQDPDLRAQFLHLAETDRVWTKAARSAQFVPRAAWDNLSPVPSRTCAWMLAALAFVAVVARIVPKVVSLDLVAAMLLHGVVLGGMIAVVLWIGERAVPRKESSPETAT